MSILIAVDDPRDWLLDIPGVTVARGHGPLPRLNTVGDLLSPSVVRVLTEGLDELIQRALAEVPGDSFDLGIYFGRNKDRRFDPLSQQLFNLIQAPLLCAQLYKHHDGQWDIRSVRPVAARDIPRENRRFVVQAATDYFLGRERKAMKRAAPSYDLAILVDPTDPEPPS